MQKYSRIAMLLVGQLFLCLAAISQHPVRIIINKLPAYHAATDTMYLAGSFNQWHPQHVSYRFHRMNDEYVLDMELPAGKYEYKTTAGGWAKAETLPGGGQKPNRQLVVDGPDTIRIEIDDWAHHFGEPVKRSTASRNVKIIDTAFYIPQLNRNRRIWIYLPDTYQSSRHRYPVLYMHDGQNVFDESTSYSGEWGVDEALDTLGVSCRNLIVVAIDNGGEKRMNEYAPFDMERYGKGEGDAYADFIVNTLMPYVQKNYRVSNKRKDRFIAGSSMGGLISFYTVLKYPRAFGGAGIFSPAFWVAPAIENTVNQQGRKLKSRLYFFAGMQEGEQMVPDMLRIFEQMNKVSRLRMTSVIRAEGRHHESTWRKEFPLFYCWMMGE